MRSGGLKLLVFCCKVYNCIIWHIVLDSRCGPLRNIVRLQMVSVKRRHCEDRSCKTRPTFGYKSGGLAVCCARHQLPGMMDVKSRRCEEPVCTVMPSFGYKIDGRAVRCKTHQLPGMENVKCRRCKSPGCNILPCFGYEADWKAVLCAKHRLPGMENVAGRRCEEPGCKTQPTFGYEAYGRAVRCAPHHLPGMEDVRTARCREHGCKVVPCFGYEIDRRSLRCKAHCLHGMVNLKGRRCEVYRCKTSPVFGYDADGGAVRCVNHILPDMVDVMNRRCEQHGCKTQPVFGYTDDGRALRCSTHRLPGMEDVVNRRCAEPSCKTAANRDWGDGSLCARCYAAKNPGDTLVKARYKTEEKLALFYGSRLGAVFDSGGMNARNVRGARAPTWVKTYELDFLLADGAVNDECDGIQHFAATPHFKTDENRVARDAKKMALALEAGVSVTRMPQLDIWNDRYDWRTLKRAQLSLAVEAASTKRLDPSVLLACSGEDDWRYERHVETLRKIGGSKLAAKCYYCWMEGPDVMAVRMAVSGKVLYWRPSAGFSLKNGSSRHTGRFVISGFKRQTRLI